MRIGYIKVTFVAYIILSGIIFGDPFLILEASGADCSATAPAVVTASLSAQLFEGDFADEAMGLVVLAVLPFVASVSLPIVPQGVKAFLCFYLFSFHLLCDLFF